MWFMYLIPNSLSIIITGAGMASICPNALLKMANNVGLDEEEAVEENSFFGHVTKIDGDIFLEFSVRDQQGKTSKFYWLTFIESNIDLSVNYETLIDKSVRIDAVPQEIFDARIGEYRTVHVITKIKLVGV